MTAWRDPTGASGLPANCPPGCETALLPMQAACDSRGATLSFYTVVDCHWLSFLRNLHSDLAEHRSHGRHCHSRFYAVHLPADASRVRRPPPATRGPITTILMDSKHPMLILIRDAFARIVRTCLLQDTPRRTISNIPIVDPGATLGRARVRSHCRFRNRGTEYVRTFVMEWMGGGTSRQCDRALRRAQVQHLPRHDRHGQPRTLKSFYHRPVHFVSDSPYNILSVSPYTWCRQNDSNVRG